MTQSRLANSHNRNWGAAVWFFAAFGILLLASILEAEGDRRVVIPWLETPLPETCTLRLRFGIDCPGCGLTRGFLHVAHGRLMNAYDAHPLSLPLFAMTLVQLPLAIAHWIPVQKPWLRSTTRGNMACLFVLAGLMLFRWLWLLGSGTLFSAA